MGTQGPLSDRPDGHGVGIHAGRTSQQSVAVSVVCRVGRWHRHDGARRGAGHHAHQSLVSSKHQHGDRSGVCRGGRRVTGHRSIGSVPDWCAGLARSLFLVGHAVCGVAPLGAVRAMAQDCSRPGWTFRQATTTRSHHAWRISETGVQDTRVLVPRSGVLFHCARCLHHSRAGNRIFCRRRIQSDRSGHCIWILRHLVRAWREHGWLDG